MNAGRNVNNTKWINNDIMKGGGWQLWLVVGLNLYLDSQVLESHKTFLTSFATFHVIK